MVWIRVGWNGRHVHARSLAAHDGFEGFCVFWFECAAFFDPLGQHHKFVLLPRSPHGDNLSMHGAQAEGAVQNAGFGRLQPRFWDLVDRHGVGDELVVTHRAVSGPETLQDEGAPNALGAALFGRLTRFGRCLFHGSAQFGQHQLDVRQFRGQAFLLAGEVGLETGRLLG